jgi:hypothetical protein
MVKLRLLNPKLQFIPFGKGKTHARWNGLIARWNGLSNSGALAVDRSKFTMCGRTITDEMKPMSERAIDVERICGNCYSSLRTYGPQVELVKDSEVAG